MSKMFLCEGQYDERQLRERDRIGMQTLIAVFLAVLADGLVREAGLDWTSPQHSAFLIVVGGPGTPATTAYSTTSSLSLCWWRWSISPATPSGATSPSPKTAGSTAAPPC